MPSNTSEELTVSTESVVGQNTTMRAGFNVTDYLENTILPRGHVLQGSPTGGYQRSITILDSRTDPESATLLGWGVDGSAELAIVRAAITYALREEDGLKSIDSTTYPESSAKQVRPVYPGSVLDRIVCGDFMLFRDGETVAAWSKYSETAYKDEAITGIGPDARTAIEALAALWLRNGQTIDAPAISSPVAPWLQAI